MFSLASCNIVASLKYFALWKSYRRRNLSSCWNVTVVIDTDVEKGKSAVYKKKEELFQEESYLPRIFRSSSLNLDTFHLIDNVFWCQIFFREHSKSTPNDQQNHDGLVVDVVIMTSQCRCTRALSQSHIAKHHNHMLVTPLIGSGTDCPVDSMAAVWPNHISKNIKITLKLRPTIYNCIANLFVKA